jgi:membrane protease YdiL (CAAX protease family)
MKKFISERPIGFAIGVSLFDLALGFLIFIIGSVIGLPEETLEWVALLATTALPLILIGWLGWWQDAGFIATTQNTFALAIPLVIALFILAWFGTVALPGSMVVRLHLAFFLTALSEESLSRGLLLRALLPCGKWQAVLIPSVLFGLGHITHFLFFGHAVRRKSAANRKCGTVRVPVCGRTLAGEQYLATHYPPHAVRYVLGSFRALRHPECHWDRWRACIFFCHHLGACTHLRHLLSPSPGYGHHRRSSRWIGVFQSLAWS